MHFATMRVSLLMQQPSFFIAMETKEIELFLTLTSLKNREMSENKENDHSSIYPFHIQIVVDYTTVFLLFDFWCLLMMGLDFGWQQRYDCSHGRVVVLLILALLLYPFLWAWMIMESQHTLQGIRPRNPRRNDVPE
ncbi:hypothetical protein VNO77_19483 [Canavalia gladiata]|uniref:Uncharacterized protein n=1 Tax=Canavalia gladiata TaxID=3824 RepID=A0AAN9LMT6_CANGL